MEAMPHPSRRDYRSVRRFFSNEVPLVKEEMTYLKWEEDLITLRNGRECAGFDGLVEAILQRVNYQLEKINCRLVKVSPGIEFCSFCALHSDLDVESFHDAGAQEEDEK